MYYTIDIDWDGRSSTIFLIQKWNKKMSSAHIRMHNYAYKTKYVLMVILGNGFTSIDGTNGLLIIKGSDKMDELFNLCKIIPANKFKPWRDGIDQKKYSMDEAIEHLTPYAIAYSLWRST